MPIAGGGWLCGGTTAGNLRSGMRARPPLGDSNLPSRCGPFVPFRAPCPCIHTSSNTTHPAPSGLTHRPKLDDHAGAQTQIQIASTHRRSRRWSDSTLEPSRTARHEEKMGGPLTKIPEPCLRLPKCRAYGCPRPGNGLSISSPSHSPDPLNLGRPRQGGQWWRGLAAVAPLERECWLHTGRVHMPWRLVAPSRARAG